jgi:hypothetical protein
VVKVKNVRSGIVIIADAGLKLGPGEVAEMARLTAQAEKAIEGGLLARVEAEPEPKQKTKGAAKADEQTGDSGKQPEAQSPAEQKSDSQPAKADSGVKNGAG